MKARRLVISLVLISLIMTACSAPTPTPEVPTPTTTLNVEIFRDLVYVEPLQQYVLVQKLDVYKPIRSGTWPIVVFLHGLNATKKGYAKESSAIAEQGAVVFVPNWPAMTADMGNLDGAKGFREVYEVLACAIRFARSNAAYYGGDPSNLTLIGHSYGAAYGSWMALAGDSLQQSWDEFATERGGPPSQVECTVSEGSFNVDAFIGIAGRYSFAEKLGNSDPELWNIVSPFAHIGRESGLPVRLLHGERDTVVDPDISIQMNDILVESDYDTRLILFDGIHRVPIELTAEVFLDLVGE